MDSLRKDYLQTQELLHQTTLDKELLEGEKQKFCELFEIFLFILLCQTELYILYTN